MQHALDLESVGDFSGAERTLTASVHKAEQPSSDPLWLPTALDRLGLLNWDLGRIRQAEQFYLRAADLWQTRFGPSNLGLATTLSDLAWVYVGLGDPSHAQSLWRHSLEIRTVILGPSDPTVAQVYGYMAVSAFGAHRLDEAATFCQQALRIYERSGKIPGETDQVLSSLASVRLRQGRASEAIQLTTEAIAPSADGEASFHTITRRVLLQPGACRKCGGATGGCRGALPTCSLVTGGASIRDPDAPMQHFVQLCSISIS